MRTTATLLIATLLLATALCADFHGDVYQKKSAKEKLQLLWDASTSSPNPARWYSTIELAALFIENMNTTMNTIADDMPKSILGTRQKLVHTVGAVAQAKFVSNGKHKYTGGFAGTDNLLIRFSLAAEPQKGTNIIPGIAFKFLRDQVPSANMMAMYSLEGQSSWNLFEHDLSNHIADLSANASFILKQIKSTFSKASQFPNRVGISCVSTIDQAGKTVEAPVHPYQMVFKPNEAIKKMFPSEYTGVSFLDQLESIPVQTLYTVYAKSGPDATDLEEMGTIELVTQFTTTSFGDRNLFFQHCRYENDLKGRPHWVAAMQLKKK